MDNNNIVLWKKRSYISLDNLYSQVKNGHIKRISDEDIQSLIIEIMGANVR